MRTTYRLLPDNPQGTDPWVDFVVADPADPHEGMLCLHLSRAAWAAQGSPPELTLALTVPIVAAVR